MMITPHTVTILIPAHNSAQFVADTITSALTQTRPADRVLVAADRCTDDTARIALELGADVIEVDGGSKAKAQNAALPYVMTDLCLPLDDDSCLAPTYLAEILPIFEADRTHEVSVAAGKVLTRYDRTWTERARMMEYLFNFHSLRPLQQATGSVTVAAGCCSVFRVGYLRAAGGFPERTLTEDIDYSLTQHRMRRRVEYCARAVCYAAEPDTTALMRTQLRRWKHGWQQAVKTNLPGLLVRKQRVAGWLISQLYELAMSPLILALPFILAIGGGWHALLGLAPYVAATELALFWVPVLIGCHVTGYPVRRAVASYPAWLALKVLNFEADMRAGVVNFVLVPLRLRKPYLTYVIGHATS